MTMSGTQKLMNCPEMYFTVTMTFRMPVTSEDSSIEFMTSPETRPITSAKTRRNGRLWVKPFFSIKTPSMF